MQLKSWNSTDRFDILITVSFAISIWMTQNPIPLYTVFTELQQWFENKLIKWPPF
jgi:hypothetical protein